MRIVLYGYRKIKRSLAYEFCRRLYGKNFPDCTEYFSSIGAVHVHSPPFRFIIVRIPSRAGSAVHGFSVSRSL